MEIQEITCMKNKDIVDSILEEHFHNIDSVINKNTSIVCQDFISRGLYNSTICATKILEAYLEEFISKVSNIISLIDERSIDIDWHYLEDRINELLGQIYTKANSSVCQHLLKANLPNQIDTFQKIIEKRKMECSDIIKKKIKTVSAIKKNIKEIDQYENILEIIRHTGATFEETPSTYIKLGEEDLRNNILSHLNSHYKGEATGETFRGKGKTDIRIEFKDRSAFVAECKIWSGEKTVTKTIGQLLGYLIRRDSKSCIILFNKNVCNFTSIQNKIPNIFKKHPKYVSDCQDKHLEEWRYIMKSKDDDDRHIIVHVFLFNLYSC